MNTNREHLLQNGKLRAHMNDVGFVRPWSPPIDREFLPYSNRAILMPHHLPVRFWTFVEEDSPHRKAFGSQHRCDRLPHLIRTCDPAHDLVGEEIANSMLVGVECRF